jgi:hypothetical protein
MERFGQVIGVKPEARGVRPLPCGVWPEILDMIHAVQHPQLFDLPQGPPALRLLRVRGRRLRGRHGQDGGRPEDAGVVGHHDAHAAAHPHPRRGRVVGQPGRGLSHRLGRSPLWSANQRLANSGHTNQYGGTSLWNEQPTPGQTRPHEQGVAPPGARPRAGQRFLLGQLPGALARRPGPAGRHQHL